MNPCRGVPAKKRNRRGPKWELSPEDEGPQDQEEASEQLRGILDLGKDTGRDV